MTQSLPRNEAPQAHQANDVSLNISSLRAQGANRFDPVAFHFIESLARKSLQHQGAVKQLLETKLTKALADYRVRFERARADAEMLIARVSAEYPDTAEDLQRLFEEADFKGVTQLSARLTKNQRPVSLADLTRAMQHDESDDGSQDNEFDSNSFEELLRKQEREALQSHVNGAPGPANTPQSEFGELKSMRLFRQAWAKQSADNRIEHAIEQAPKDAGPLNSHRLVTRSLATMREISPAYLNRLVSYIDALLWLEQAGKKSETAVEKVPAGKAKTKSRRGRAG